VLEEKAGVGPDQFLHILLRQDSAHAPSCSERHVRRHLLLGTGIAVSRPRPGMRTWQEIRYQIEAGNTRMRFWTACPAPCYLTRAVTHHFPSVPHFGSAEELSRDTLRMRCA